jgi:ABC-type uncharacterized transport system substrate-binding protein
MLARVIFGVALGLAGPAVAHPHVWVDAAITAVFDDEGRVAAFEISWTYDEFYTLMILEERGLDPDGDGELTEAETASLQGFDMAWRPEFPGDSYVLLNEGPVEIGRPETPTARVEGGFLTSTHVRRLVEPLRPGAGMPLILQSYDPEYYIAYTILEGLIAGPGEGCAAVVHGFDPAMADAALTAASQEYAASTDPDMEFPKIGAAYSDEVWVTCQD